MAHLNFGEVTLCMWAEQFGNKAVLTEAVNCMSISSLLYLNFSLQRFIVPKASPHISFDPFDYECCSFLSGAPHEQDRPRFSAAGNNQRNHISYRFQRAVLRTGSWSNAMPSQGLVCLQKVASIASRVNRGDCTTFHTSLINHFSTVLQYCTAVTKQVLKTTTTNIRFWRAIFSAIEG